MANRLLRPRLLETIQCVLMAVSLAGVVQAACAEPVRPEIERQYTEPRATGGAGADRQYRDLARFDRKRREDRQHRSRKQLERGVLLEITRGE